jgi:hypothetical protein
MLSDLKRYLSERPMATLADIALHLDVEPEVARAMLDVWIGKGRVQRIDNALVCGGCEACSKGTRELYRWVDDGAADTAACTGGQGQSERPAAAEGNHGS